MAGKRLYKKLTISQPDFNNEKRDVKSVSLRLAANCSDCDHLQLRLLKTSRNEQPALIEVSCTDEAACHMNYARYGWAVFSGVSVHLFVIRKQQRGFLLTEKQMFMLCMTGYTVSAFQYNAMIYK